jgi:SP family general alpha glucoside:H+ symporter-like MFS transporter
LIILVSLAPESPWFLVRNGRLEEAEAVINRISATGEEVSAPDTIAMMVSHSCSGEGQADSLIAPNKPT